MIFAACASAWLRAGAGLFGFALACACTLGVAQQPAPQPGVAHPEPPAPGAQPTPGARPAQNVVPPAPAAPVEVTPPDAQGPVLTLEECVTRALAKGFDLEIEQQSLIVARENIPIARSAFLPVFAATTSKGVSRFAADPNLGLGATMSSTVNADAAVTQRLLTGTQLSLGLNNKHFNTDPAAAALNPAYTADATLAITQPLLKGFGTRLNSQVIRRAELDASVAGNNYEDRALNVIQDTENGYYLLTGARDQLQVFRSSLQLAQALLNEAQQRRTAGMATGLDVLQAEVGVANARRNVLESQRTVRASEDALTALIGRFLFDTPLGPTRADDDASTEPPPTIASSYRLATERYPALRNARANLEIAQLNVAFARNDLLPSVDLDLALGFNGNDSTRRGAFSGITEPDSHTWQAGISITYPLGRVAEKARFRQSRYLLTQAELREKQLEQDVLVSVRNAVRDVETSRESVTIATQAADLAQRQYEAETDRFRAGLSTSRRVLEAQTDLESARVASLQARLDLQTARAALRRLEGSSLQRYGITLSSITPGR